MSTDEKAGDKPRGSGVVSRPRKEAKRRGDTASHAACSGGHTETLLALIEVGTARQSLDLALLDKAAFDH